MGIVNRRPVRTLAPWRSQVLESGGEDRAQGYTVCLLRAHSTKRDALDTVADAGFKERGGCSGGGSPKGGGCGRGMCPLPREARKLLKTLIRCAKMHEKITSFFYLCRILRIM